MHKIIYTFCLLLYNTIGDFMIIDKQEQELKSLQEKIDIIKKCIDKTKFEGEIELLKQEQNSPDFWADQKNAQKN